MIRLIKVERVDDIPVLLAEVQKTQVSALLDQFFPTHGHWKGELSFGEVVAVWLTFVASQGDHCLSHVQPWVEEHLDTLRACLGKGIRPLDFSDDRLAAMLDRFSEAETWGEFETALNGVVLRVYEFEHDRIRIDSTSAKTYAGVSERGLFQFGLSHDHRPDLPQVKISLSALDPLGLPLTTTVVSGRCADDPLYVPEIKRVQQTLGAGGKTDIGDCKMGALQTRALVAQSGDYYVCPLAGKQMPAEELEKWVLPVVNSAQELEPVYHPGMETQEQPRLIAEGYEVRVELEAEVDGQPVQWQERRLVVRSVAHAARQAEHLDKRLRQAVAEIGHLNERKQGKKILEVEELKLAAHQIMERRRVAGMVKIETETTTRQTTKRKYGAREAEIRLESRSTISAQIEPQAVEEAKQRLGWRVYATHHGILARVAVIMAYRGQYLIERCFGRLKGKALSLTPLFVQTETRVEGLIRLLSLALRLLILVEFVVRRQLEKAQSKVAGLYPGQATRTTASPTAELILRAFQGISLTVVEIAGQVRALLSPLSHLHQRLLKLLGLSADIYVRLTQHFLKPALNLSEP
ncbi:MAG: IS1634 family transposase [Gammaproteobacteria bacterium]